MVGRKRSIHEVSTWTTLTNTVEKFGKLIFCSPWNTCVNSSSALGILPTDILTWLTTLCNLLLWVDSLFYTSWMTYMGADTISGAIEASLGYFAMVVSELIIRSSSIFFRALKVEMTNHLQSFPPRPSHCQHWRLLLPVAVWIPLWFISSIIDNSRSELLQPLPKDFKPFLLPHDAQILNVVYFLGNTWAILSILHAWTWVVVIGTALICRLEHFTEKYEALALRNACIAWVTSRKGVTTFPLVSEFLIIKANFETYGKVAGAYGLALVMYFGVSIVGYLGGMMTENQGGYGYIPEMQLILASVFLISLVLVINFGSRISKAVKSHKEQLMNLEIMMRTQRDSETAKLLTCLSRWNWKLSALDMFDIDRGLIPKVMATILGYFTFLFQLKASEEHVKS